MLRGRCIGRGGAYNLDPVKRANCWTLLIFLATACASSRVPLFRVVPPTGWERMQTPPDGDAAWRDRATHAVIAANATCHGHHDPPLTILANDLLIGTTARRYLLEEDATLDGRAARHAVVALQVDGVPLIYDLYVVKKDGCVYDLTLICRPRAYDAVADSFVRFVADFRAARGAR